MKTNSKSRIGQMFTRIINVREWADVARLKSFTVYLKSMVIRLFIPQQHTVTESFAEAIAKLKLSERDLELKKNALYRLTWLMLVFAMGILCYVAYSIYYSAITAALISLVLFMVALVLAFRYHFWYFQMKKRKLGCSFSEWFKEGFLGDKA